MYDTEALAVRVAQRTASMLRDHRISNVGDKIFVNLAITGATQEALTIFQDVKSANETLPILFGEAVPGTYVNLISMKSLRLCAATMFKIEQLIS